MRSSRGIDLGIYPKALGLLVRHPQIVLAPLAAALANVLLLSTVPADGGFLGFANSSILSLIAFVIDAFGLGVAIVAADSAWRYGRAPLDDAVRESARLAWNGDAVLLSPACSSYDMFRDYKHRGDEFVRAVREMGGVDSLFPHGAKG